MATGSGSYSSPVAQSRSANRARHDFPQLIGSHSTSSGTTATSSERRARGQTGSSELRSESVGPLHGSSLGGPGAARRRAAPVCSGTESAPCRSFVGHPCTGRQWTAIGAAEKIYGSLRPSFYGLRTTLVAYVLLALLRIPRPEALKEYPPGELGRIVGLDRMPEVKTLRRKLARLAASKGSFQLGQEIARQRIAERGKVLGFLYVDGHVRAYHGKHTIPKAYVTRARLAAPATTDYWVNDKRGDPLFVVTAEANAAITRMLPIVLREVRQLLGSKRRATVVFDRGGWSPKLFRELLALGFDILTYRKGRTRKIAEARFTQHKAKLDGRRVHYLLHEQPVRFLKGKLRLRQITRLIQGGHQTPIVTSRWDLRAIVLAYRMFERWRQENFFKYVREEFLVDALADYEIEPDDPNRSVPNPARKAIEKELRRMRTQLGKLRASYAAITLDARPRRLPRTEAKKAKEKLRTEIAQAKARLEKLQAQHHALP